MEEIWVEGRVRESWRHLFFYFPQPLAFFGFSPLNFLIRAKMHKLKKETKGRIHDPILTLPVWGRQGGGPNGGGWVVVFLLGGWTLAPRRKFEYWSFLFQTHLKNLRFLQRVLEGAKILSSTGSDWREAFLKKKRVFLEKRFWRLHFVVPQRVLFLNHRINWDLWCKG